MLVLLAVGHGPCDCVPHATHKLAPPMRARAQSFTGSQRLSNAPAGSSEDWQVVVRLQGVDLAKGYVCGVMEVRVVCAFEFAKNTCFASPTRTSLGRAPSRVRRSSSIDWRCSSACIAHIARTCIKPQTLWRCPPTPLPYHYRYHTATATIPLPYQGGC